MKDRKTLQELSSEDSTIDIMSSGDEHIDITNDLDPPESSAHYVTDVNSSASEIAQKSVFNIYNFIYLIFLYDFVFLIFNKFNIILVLNQIHMSAI